jgi:NAD(P)-dependent dehydrogenase (short-subunit alcohol dehydrogenase family)
MVAQKIPGVIVNVSSVMAVLALADQVPYCAAKGGVNQFTKATALALSDYGIRVNAIGPGPVLTELMQRVVHNKEKEAELLARLPLGRIAECREIATVAVFLACDDSSFFTGQTIYPDGGRMIQAFSRKKEN